MVHELGQALAAELPLHAIICLMYSPASPMTGSFCTLLSLRLSVLRIVIIEDVSKSLCSRGFVSDCGNHISKTLLTQAEALVQ